MVNNISELSIVREKPYLTLGWRVTEEGAPRYWLDPNVKPGGQSDEELVIVDGNKMRTHTVIVAQSGSGKSFFLGRLLEELLTQIDCRCLILDPNGDFRKVHEINDETLWKEARYADGKGKLPHEPSRTEFTCQWNKLRMRIMMGDARQQQPPYEQLKLWWPEVSVEFLSEDLGPKERAELYHCHASVQIISELVQKLHTEGLPWPSVISVAEDVMMNRAFDLSYILDENYGLLSDITELLIEQHDLIRVAEERLKHAKQYFSKQMIQFYFAKARQFEAIGILAKEPASRFLPKGDLIQTQIEMIRIRGRP